MFVTLDELAATRIRKARRLREYSQGQAAELVGVSQNAWATYENGSRGVSLKMLEKIAKKLEFPVEFFVNANFDITIEDVSLKKAAAKR